MATVISGDTGVSQIQDGVVSSSAKIAPGAVAQADLDATNKAAQCKAWVNFNGSGTVGTNQTIRASYNVASVFKNATGDYTITLTTPMADANAAAFPSAIATGSSDNNFQASLHKSAGAVTASTVRIITRNSNVFTTLIDCDYVMCQVYGN